MTVQVSPAPLRGQPTFVHCGDDSADLERWLTEVEVRSVEDLLALSQVGFERWRATSKLLGR